MQFDRSLLGIHVLSINLRRQAVEYATLLLLLLLSFLSSNSPKRKVSSISFPDLMKCRLTLIRRPLAANSQPPLERSSVLASLQRTSKEHGKFQNSSPSSTSPLSLVDPFLQVIPQISSTPLPSIDQRFKGSSAELSDGLEKKICVRSIDINITHSRDWD